MLYPRLPQTLNTAVETPVAPQAVPPSDERPVATTADASPPTGHASSSSAPERPAFQAAGPLFVGRALIYRAGVKAVRTCMEIANMDPSRIATMEYRLLSPLRNPTTTSEDAAAVKFIAAYLRLPRNQQQDHYISAIAGVMRTAHTTMTAYLAVINSVAKSQRELREREDRKFAKQAVAQQQFKMPKLDKHAFYDYEPPTSEDKALLDLQMKVRKLESEKADAHTILQLFEDTFGSPSESELRKQLLHASESAEGI